MNVSDARLLALKRLRELEIEWGVPLAIFEGPEQGNFGWLFYFNSAAYVETEHLSDLLVGAGPLLVSPKGTVYVLPSALNCDDEIVRGKLSVLYP